MSKQTFIYLPSKEGQQWVREKSNKQFGRPDHWNTESEDEHLAVEEAYQKEIASLKSYPFEGPPGKPGEEVEGELWECAFCDGVGWFEGGQTLKTNCGNCNGSGVVVKAISTKGKTEVRSDYFYKPIPIAERIPNLLKYGNDRLILLDDYYDVIKVVKVGLLTEWEAIVGSAEYWLEKTETNLKQQ